MDNEVTLTRHVLNGNADDAMELLSGVDCAACINKRVDAEKTVGCVHTSLFDYQRYVTPFCRACEYATIDVVRALIRHGADLHVTEEGEWYCLHVACASKIDRLSKVQHLLELDFTLLSAVNRYKNTPLHIAAYHGHHDALRHLLEHGASVNAVGRFDRTPLHYTAFQGSSDCLNTLLRHDADVEAADESQSTALNIAAAYGRVENVSILLRHGASIHACDSFKNPPLCNAAYMGRFDVITLLLERGADVNVAGFSQQTPLHKASQNGFLTCVSALLQHGADVRLTDNDGNTPLDLALRSDQRAVAELLRQHANIKNQSTIPAPGKPPASSTSCDTQVIYWREEIVTPSLKRDDGKSLH